MKPEELLFALMRAAICGEKVSEPIKEACTPDVLEQVYILAQKHDLAHLPGHVLGNLGLPDSKPLKKLKRATYSAVYRQMQIEAQLKQICATLEQAKIQFIPLKGAVLRSLYPEPWMRTSCDIDILVHEEDLGRAVETLLDRLRYTTDHKKHYHNISLFSPGGIHLELHFSIRENMANLDGLLIKAWEHTVPVTQYQYALENDFLAFHLLAHMSYHFVSGGCGIRPVLDVFLLKERSCYNETVLRSYLSQCGIEKFYDSILELMEMLFHDGTQTTLATRMAEYLLSGGAYGNQTQRIAIQHQRKGGKFGYLFGRIFMPYRDLKIRYPLLEKYPFLFPAMQICRWLELFFSGGLKRSMQETKIIMQTEDDKSKAVNDLLRQLGL